MLYNNNIKRLFIIISLFFAYNPPWQNEMMTDPAIASVFGSEEWRQPALFTVVAVELEESVEEKGLITHGLGCG